MLIEKTFQKSMRHIIAQTHALNMHRFDVGKFEELCAMLRSRGCTFEETLDTDDDEVNYHIYPAHSGDYLSMVEILCEMGAHRTRTGELCEIVNPEPDAPTFWLHIPSTF